MRGHSPRTLGRLLCKLPNRSQQGSVPRFSRPSWSPIEFSRLCLAQVWRKGFSEILKCMRCCRCRAVLPSATFWTAACSRHCRCEAATSLDGAGHARPCICAILMHHPCLSRISMTMSSITFIAGLVARQLHRKLPFPEQCRTWRMISPKSTQHGDLLQDQTALLELILPLSS